MLSFEAKMRPNPRKAQTNDIIRSSSSMKRQKSWWRNARIKCTWIIYKERSGLNLVIPRATPQLNPAMVASAYPTSNPSCTENFLPASTPSLYPSFLLSRTKPQRQFHLLDTIYKKNKYLPNCHQMNENWVMDRLPNDASSDITLILINPISFFVKICHGVT